MQIENGRKARFLFIPYFWLLEGKSGLYVAMVTPTLVPRDGLANILPYGAMRKLDFPQFFSLFSISILFKVLIHNCHFRTIYTLKKKKKKKKTRNSEEQVPGQNPTL